jgi:hypothetical protein
MTLEAMVSLEYHMTLEAMVSLEYHMTLVGFMVFNVTFNNISVILWRFHGKSVTIGSIQLHTNKALQSYFGTKIDRSYTL